MVPYLSWVASQGKMGATDTGPPAAGATRDSAGGWGGRMDPLAGVENTALTEGVKLLFQQAAEALSAWRARRDRQASAPQALDPRRQLGSSKTAPTAGSGKPGDG